MIDRVIPMWKPMEWTSFDVVRKIKNQIKPTKIGHAGTLDPFAEGVLLLCTGKKTKLIEHFMNEIKEYECEIILGSETDTLDLTGKVVKISDVPIFDIKKINNVLKQFQGKILQEPPMYSALKFNGIPLYKLARKGILIKRNKRVVNIYKIKLNSHTPNSINITVQCGRGTYIRSLAKDIAATLGTVAYLNKLKRTKVGNVDESACLTINEFPKWLSTKI